MTETICIRDEHGVETNLLGAVLWFYTWPTVVGRCCCLIRKTELVAMRPTCVDLKVNALGNPI